MKRFVVNLVLSLMTVAAAAQTASQLSDSFYDQLKHKQFEKAEKTLNEWTNLAPDDAELWPARFNFYLNRGYFDMMCLSTDTDPQGMALMLGNDDGSLAGSIQSIQLWNPVDFDAAILAIEQGIKEHPDRLDFRLGEKSAFVQNNKWDKAVDVLCDAVEYQYTRHPKWLWTNGADLPDDDVLVMAISEVIQDMYEVNNGADAQAYRLIDKTLQYDPENFKIVNLKGALQVADKDFDGALTTFAYALTLSPNDEVILANLAYTNELKGNKQEAIKIYRQMLDNTETTEEYRRLASDAIAELAQ